MAPKRRSAALVISAFVEPNGNPAWYARIAYYEDAEGPAFRTRPRTTIEGVCDEVRRWLESVVDDHSDQSHRGARVIAAAAGGSKRSRDRQVTPR